MATASKADIECKLLSICEKLDYYKDGRCYLKFSLQKHQFKNFVFLCQLTIYDSTQSVSKHLSSEKKVKITKYNKVESVFMDYFWLQQAAHLPVVLVKRS
jgi:hypothetical protein